MKFMFRKFAGFMALTAVLSASLTDLRGGVVSQKEEPGTQCIIGISPFLDNSVKDDVYRRVVRLIVEDLPLGASLRIYDAYHLKSITAVEVPNLRAFASGKTRANQFATQIHEFKEFLAKSSGAPTNTGTISLKDAVRFPQFLDFVAENLRDNGESNAAPLTMVILGSPLYMDPKEPGFSMVNGYFPTDAHLGASRDRTVYGTKGPDERLKDVSVRYGYFGDPWLNEAHQEKINRFWSLYLKRQGARLTTFCGDLATVFSIANSAGTLAKETREPDSGSTKIEMVRVSRDIGTTDWITRDKPSNLASGPPSRTVGPMKIGIRWKGDIDLDLYARASKHATMLYFEQTRAEEGYYYKDHRSSPDREYEFIEFEAPINVWEANARVNFFEGHTDSGPGGEVRIEFDGKIYTAPFHLESNHGNEGRNGRTQGAFWTEIDIPAILNLRKMTEAQ
jgi:hypothetical protein